MRPRLYDLFFLDRAARLKMYAVSYIVALVFGLLSLILGSSAQESLVGSIIAAGITIGAWTYVYCSSHPVRSQINLDLMMPRRTAIAAASIIAFSSALGLKTTQLEGAIISRKLKSLGSLKAIDAQTVKSVTRMLAYATDNGISIDPAAGKRFIEAAQRDPKAWDVALDFAAYRSTLNAIYRPNLPTKPIEPTVFKYGVKPVTGKPVPQFGVAHLVVTKDQAARYDNIGLDQNENQSVGPALMFATGGAVALDGLHLRNVIFQGVEIHYSGSPVILENVMFINCTFVFDNNDRSRQLGQQLLSSSSVNFRALG